MLCSNKTDFRVCSDTETFTAVQTGNRFVATKLTFVSAAMLKHSQLQKKKKKKERKKADVFLTAQVAFADANLLGTLQQFARYVAAIC